MALPGQFEVGQLYRDGYVNGIKTFAQPGGVGTPVTPQMAAIFPERYQGYPRTPLAYAPQYFFGCAHPLNMPEVNSYFDPYDEEMKALICCPLCGWIQQIIPYLQYQDYLQTPLVVA